MYSATLLQHFREPKCVGVLPPPAVVVEVMNPICGDILRVSAQIGINGTIEQAAFQAKGCTASIAAGSALVEWTVGKSGHELAAFTTSDMEILLDGLPNESKHAAVLAVEAAHALAAKTGVRTSP